MLLLLLLLLLLFIIVFPVVFPATRTRFPGTDVLTCVCGYGSTCPRQLIGVRVVHNRSDHRKHVLLLRNNGRFWISRPGQPRCVLWLYCPPAWPHPSPLQTRLHTQVLPHHHLSILGHISSVTRTHEVRCAIVSKQRVPFHVFPLATRDTKRLRLWVCRCCLHVRV